MNELRCEECGALWYSASDETARRPCEACGGRLATTREPERRPRRFLRVAEEPASPTEPTPAPER